MHLFLHKKEQLSTYSRLIRDTPKVNTSEILKRSSVIKNINETMAYMHLWVMEAYTIMTVKHIWTDRPIILPA